MMNEYKEEINSSIRKRLTLITGILVTALLIGVILGFLDGLFDIISNNIVFDHPTDEQTLSFFQKVLYLVYSMTLSEIFYGVLGLALGFVFLVYSAKYRKANTSELILISSLFLFLLIIFKTEVLLFSSFISGPLAYLLFMGIALLIPVLFGFLMYKLSHSQNQSSSSKEKDFTSSAIRLVIASILFWGIVSLLAKIFKEKSNFFISLTILMVGVIMTLISYLLIKRMFVDDRIKQWRGGVRFTTIVALLTAFLVVLSFLGIYQEARSRDSSLHYNDDVSLTQGSKNKPNVILILIDTLRADHLSSYGYERQTSPNIDEMAKDGVLFWNAVAQSSWTKPSIASLITSLYPSTHGVIYAENMLTGSVTTLAEYMKEAGYRTAGFVANPQVKAIFNFDQGFDHYDDTIVEDKVYYNVLRSSDIEKRIIRRLLNLRLGWTDNNNAEMLNKKFIPWLKENSNTNFFLYLHYIDPHEPYSPPRPFDTKYSAPNVTGNERNIALYDGEIAYIDRHMGELLETLKGLKILDKTLVIFTSDHGEEFLDHGGTGHGQSLYEELIRVPLIMRYPPSLPAGRVIKNYRVELIDVMPSILEILNISWNKNIEGTSLLPIIRGEGKADNNGYIFSESYLSRFQGRAVTHKNWKYIYTESSQLRDISKLGPEELYNLESDPKELNNLIRESPELAREMREKLLFLTQYVKEKAVSSPTKAKVDERTKEQLKALGYVD